MPETIEAEVIEIDGKPPEPAAAADDSASGGAWGGFGRFRTLKLDRRWWPVWVVLGIVVVGLAIVFGLLFGLLYLGFALVRSVLRLLFGSGGGPDGGSLSRG
ncbi:hypothetical protein HAHE_33200 [Haloferula helveola]|uniref:Uncharacterized protein n=1 Tax=Haloferula helveola TaxID=490095 RepID=A0ABN6H937_9BACT|nr:hypothetical protein HAHE_33200 [Haloferula helveola]